MEEMHSDPTQSLLLVFFIIFHNKQKKVNLSMRETERSYCPKVTYNVSEGFTGPLRHCMSSPRSLRRRGKTPPNWRNSERDNSKRDPFSMDGWESNKRCRWENRDGVEGVGGRKLGGEMSRVANSPPVHLNNWRNLLGLLSIFFICSSWSTILSITPSHLVSRAFPSSCRVWWMSLRDWRRRDLSS